MTNSKIKSTYLPAMYFKALRKKLIREFMEWYTDLDVSNIEKIIEDYNHYCNEQEG